MNHRLCARSILVALAVALPLGGCSFRTLADHEGVSPAKGHTITSVQIEKAGARTVWDALKLLSGKVRFQDDNGGNAATMASRGQSSIAMRSEPIVFMDGVRMPDYRVLSEISARHVESIQLLTGPDATTYYGTNAHHGVLIIRTRMPEDGAGRP